MMFADVVQPVAKTDWSPIIIQIAIVLIPAIAAWFWARTRLMTLEAKVKGVSDDVDKNTELTKTVQTDTKQTAAKLEQVGKDVDGRLSQLIEAKTAAATAEGEQRGQLIERALTAEGEKEFQRGQLEAFKEVVTEAIVPAANEKINGHTQKPEGK